MAEFKLSYTANEINRKLGRVDNLVSTVNGVSPDANGNVNIDVSVGAGESMIEDMIIKSIFKSVILYEGVTKVDYREFYGAPKITTIEIPKSIDSISSGAFSDYSNLTEVTFKGIPSSISPYTFTGCANLMTITVPWSEDSIANAPWGADNATVYYKVIFTIDGITDVVECGTTWRQWINSSAEAAQAYGIHKGYVYCKANEKYVLNDDKMLDDYEAIESVAYKSFGMSIHSCDHSNSGYVAIDDKTHTLKCSDCGEEMATVEAHNFANGVCNLCGYEIPNEPENTCEHPAENIYYHTVDSERCVEKCDICDTELGEPIPHSFSDGCCNNCGYCQHLSSHAIDIFDDHHRCFCDNCGVEFDEPHNFVNGVCTVCDYKTPDEPDEPASDITFTIEGAGRPTYTVKAGTTFAEWVSMTYDEENGEYEWFDNGTEISNNFSGGFLCNTNDLYDTVHPNDVIEARTYYSVV